MQMGTTAGSAGLGLRPWMHLAESAKVGLALFIMMNQVTASILFPLLLMRSNQSHVGESLVMPLPKRPVTIGTTFKQLITVAIRQRVIMFLKM